MTKVSVVTAVYNGKEYYDRVVGSILSQTCESFEWVIVDDGSTDGTLDRLKTLSEKKSDVKVYSPGRIGFVKALDYGIQRSNGKYIARQDFDDVSKPERLKAQVDFLDNNEDYGIVSSSYKVINKKRNERYIRNVPEKHENIIKDMSKCIPFPHTLTTFRKKAWREVGGYPNSDNITDLQMWIKIIKKGWKVRCLSKNLGVHIEHEESYWNSNYEYFERQKDLAQVQFRAVRDLNLPLWMSIYPAARLLYPMLPNRIKKIVRRGVGPFSEDDISNRS